MKASAIRLGWIVSAILATCQGQAAAEDQCAAAISGLKAEMIAAAAVRDEYKHIKNRKGRCVYINSQIKFLTEASRMLGLCDHLRPSERSSLIEKNANLLQRAKALRFRYCGQQVAEASSLFQIDAAPEPILGH
ncbi:hypothetical protein HPT29_005620 [Microvirga terrae]|uniref:DUF1311 domain-containing protein n=1 Tax=Microvirga terrae TaxID=2740529 RepID=A0ABY5RUI9_9HYPH|nr:MULTISPECIES: hypothetical protein [Microvirga]MBQ0823259.1 hypothetical protein [Microvirga sp. HBU67558]UVF20609.1 hypothetical protein HPT29_005620 [Microvirga terrae]